MQNRDECQLFRRAQLTGGVLCRQRFPWQLSHSGEAVKINPDIDVSFGPCEQINETHVK